MQRDEIHALQRAVAEQLLHFGKEHSLIHLVFSDRTEYRIRIAVLDPPTGGPDDPVGCGGLLFQRGFQILREGLEITDLPLEPRCKLPVILIHIPFDFRRDNLSAFRIQLRPDGKRRIIGQKRFKSVLTIEIHDILNHPPLGILLSPLLRSAGLIGRMVIHIETHAETLVQFQDVHQIGGIVPFDRASAEKLVALQLFQIVNHRSGNGAALRLLSRRFQYRRKRTVTKSGGSGNPEGIPGSRIQNHRLLPLCDHIAPIVFHLPAQDGTPFFRCIIEKGDFKFRSAPRPIKPITGPRFRSKLDDPMSAISGQRGPLELNGVQLKIRVVLIGEIEFETSGELLFVPGLVAGDAGKRNHKALPAGGKLHLPGVDPQKGRL